MTGNASARPFRGELILRWQLCWTPKPGPLDRCFSRTHSTDLPASVSRSIPQMADDFLVLKYIRAARKKFWEAATDFGYQPYLGADNSSDFISLPDLLYASFRLSF